MRAARPNRRFQRTVRFTSGWDALKATVVIATCWLPTIAETIDAPCAGITNAYQCGQAIEGMRLPALGDRARRDGGALLIRLQSGESSEFRDGQGSYFTLRLCDDLVHQCVIAEHQNEFMQYWIVDLASGQRGNYRGEVAFGPDGSRFAVGGAWGSWGSPMLEIRRIGSDAIEFSLERADLAKIALANEPDCVETELLMGDFWATASQVQWLRSEQLQFQLMCLDGDSEWLRKRYSVSYEASGWHVSKVEP